MAGIASGRANKAKAREFKASGNKAMVAGAFQKAMRQYTKALELDPGNAILYSNRSATHFNLRQFSESLEDAESAILCDEKWWKAYKRKGLALIQMQRYEDAIEALEAGLVIVGKNAEMEKNLEFAKACQEQAQNLYILPEPHMMNRLESVPVFIVTDEVGQPFFVTYEDGQQVCTFYFDKVDADSTLKWIQEENPDIGTSARVIHITLNQAFTLAQETQKQYYEETTRAAMEEDRAAAEAIAAASKASKANKVGKQAVALSAEEALPSTTNQTNDTEEAEPVEAETKRAVEPAAEVALKPLEKGEPADGGEESKTEATPDAATERSVGRGSLPDDPVTDESAPLSFQFRPELRQVEVAVELLNKHPNPPVRPILRDPPSLREAKAKARAAAAAGEKEVAVKGVAAEEATGSASETVAEPEPAVDVEAGSAGGAKGGDGEKSEEKDADKAAGTGEADGADAEVGVSDAAADETAKTSSYDDDVELTVENFNGIPMFHAKGLTMSRSDQTLLPLFCSKWDLEAAWSQLASTPGSGVAGKCEVEVGTLEDVLRRMSESKTGELDNVIFVPSRESMEAIGQKFPLDELSSRKRISKPVVKKANYSRAKQIKARGGTPDEIRAAIEEDLKVYRERQKMAEMVAQLS